MNNQVQQADVVIIGAGPSGAVAASLLVKKGWHVVVLEQQTFPRFSIGESLLPQCMSFLAEAGLEQAVQTQAQSLGFQFKNGAAFQRRGDHTTIDFTEKFSEGPGTTFQVKRADFDKCLADGAMQQGAEIRYQHSVLAFTDCEDGALLDVTDENQQGYQIKGRFVLDASGFGRVLPRLLDLESASNFPVRWAFFSHFKDNISDTQFDREKILINVHPEHKDIWYWLIPFSDGTASIGVVGKPEQLNDKQPLAGLNEFIEQDSYLSELLANREAIGEARAIKGYSANVSSLYGEHFALLGNAGEFLDPVFSSGVTIALKSASLVAPIVDSYLRGEQVDFKNDYSEPLQQGVNCFRTYVSAWYDGSFQDVIFYSEKNQQVREMISAILAGYAWDLQNPFVKQSNKRLNTLVELCRD
ncbi:MULTISPECIES: NAD(P)/FAD-dependent oxidoreductase [Pseudoalteromonas]|uniref:NAD(P)/FAD-dependent oxidoreductase n=1 Tax=Pseudoalteromonas TaxID=53246 RepID=UPI0006CA474B|nr:NAD(P)/FAD-dependent oxidoreductase [Pseudoalteromonas sp. UCD-33C]KPM77359.1 FAD-dependent oxidoreductase [Pseudoalteromonas sp. UCD-33C]MCG9734600.1 tryptophan 7-halogenase [Pseudoalteromonas shioyasakiensis]